MREYNAERRSRAAKMTPNEAASKRNHGSVKQSMEAARESSNTQERLQEGDTIRAPVKKKLEKGYKPDLHDKLYTVASKAPGNAARFVEQKHAVPMGEGTPIGEICKNTLGPQMPCMRKPQSGLLRAKEGRHMSHELQFVKH